MKLSEGYMQEEGDIRLELEVIVGCVKSFV